MAIQEITKGVLRMDTVTTHPTSRRERNIASMKAHRERKRARKPEVGMRPVNPNPAEVDAEMARQAAALHEWINAEPRRIPRF